MSIPFLASRIDSVTVYQKGALVTRAATLPQGEPVPPLIQVGNLPLSLSDSSVRVRVEGPAAPADGDTGADLPVAGNVRVSLDLAVADESLPPPDDEELKAARQRVLALSERIRHLEDRRRRLELLQLVARAENERGVPPQPSPVEARLALLDFRHASLAAVDEELLSTHAEARLAADRKEDLEQRRRAASRARQARSHELRKAAVVALRGGAVPAAPLRLVIEYMVPGARWAPSYAVELSQDLRRATVAVRAVVAQHTGEDWSGVELALATAEAMRWTELPELHALRIGRRQAPLPRLGWRPPPVGAAELYGDYDRFVAANPGPQAAPAPARKRAPTRPGPAVAPRPAMEDLAAVDFMEEHTDTWSDGEAAEMLSRMHAPGSAEKPKKRSAARARTGAPQSAAYGAAPAAPMPAAPMMAARAPAPPPASSMMAHGGGGAPPPGGGGPPAPPDEPATPEATSNQLAYGDLRMPAPGNGQRGRLVLARRRERYVELLRVREVELDVVNVVDQAVRRASQVSARALPPRHWPVAAWGGYNFVYRADGAVDIPADGDFHGIALTSAEAEVEVEHVVVPRESTDVFRRVVLHNPLHAPLLSGPADIYVGGDYLMTTDVQLAPPRGKVEIGLGVDQSIKVSRNTRYAEESAGLMGGSLTLRHEIAIEVANHRDRPVRVEVQERIPVTRENDDEVHVSVGPVEPAWAPFEPEDYPLQGGYRWHVEVPAGQRQALRAAYAIKISAKKELAGGNRREV